MRIQSSMSRAEYLYRLQENMSEHTAFNTERFTGFFLGNLFSVTHHAGYQWNRRITNEKNTAFGYLRKTADGCELRFLYVKGFLAPPQFLLWLLVINLMYLVPLPFSDMFSWKMVGVMFLISLGLAAVIAVVSAIMESFTDDSEAGRRALLSLLLDPENPYENIPNV